MLMPFPSHTRIALELRGRAYRIRGQMATQRVGRAKAPSGNRVRPHAPHRHVYVYIIKHIYEDIADHEHAWAKAETARCTHCCCGWGIPPAWYATQRISAQHTRVLVECWSPLPRGTGPDTFRGHFNMLEVSTLRGYRGKHHLGISPSVPASTPNRRRLKARVFHGRASSGPAERAGD